MGSRVADWDQIADAQRRLLADRREAERTLAADRAALERRAAEVAAEAGRLAALADHAESLRDEIAHLDHRAAAARGVLQALEDRRVPLEVAPAADQPAVPLFAGGRGGFELMTEIIASDRQLARERAGLTAARSELEKRAAELFDQRSVVAEQAAAMAHARHEWQSAERDAVRELEDLARSLDERERVVDARARQLARGADLLRRREDELSGLHAKLTAWHAGLATHERALAAARDAAAVALSARRDQLTRWEGVLAKRAGEDPADWVAYRCDRLRDERELRDGLEAARAARTAKQVAAVRDEVEALAAKLLRGEPTAVPAPHVLPEVLALQPA
jgi:chromosome segregation protein